MPAHAARTSVSASASDAWPLLMRCSLAALRRKLRRADSPLAPWWRHVVALARHDPVFFSPYTVLVALVTGAAADRERARGAFLRFLALQGEGRISNEAQYHTHVVAAPLGRWAVFYDWVADSGILDAREDAAFRDYLLDYALLFPWPHAASRARQFDNQLLANAFGAAVVGYLLGVRRGGSAAARRIFRTGVDVMRDLLGRLPPGGYSPEGSTYHEHVVQPLALLAALFLEEATGEGVPELAKLLRTSCRMIAPGGLLPAWDAYGFQQASVKSGLTWLARLTGDPNPLAVIRRGGLWYRTSLPAWEVDDRLWTLVHWPAELDPGDAPAAFPPWMEPEIGGALQDGATGVRLFQYWDECGGVPSSGRSQVNPNAITLEVGGSPLLLDGHGHPGEALVPIPEAAARAYVGERTLESVQEYIFSAWGGKPSTAEALRMALDGSIGLSNSLVLDDEFWYVPRAPRRGTGECLRRAGPLQLLASDSTDYYTDRYDVRRVARASLLVAGRYALVSDRVEAASAHALTWQAYVRQEATLAAGRVAMASPERVHCDLVPVQPGQSELLPVSGYPRLGDGRSALFRHRVAPAATARIDVLLAPQPAAVPVVDLSTGWQRTAPGAGRGTVDLCRAYLADPQTAPGAPRAFRRTLTFNPGRGRRYLVRVAASGQAVRLRVNGREHAPLLAQEKGHWPGSAETLPHLFDVTAALRRGRNRLDLVAPFFHGESVLGPVELLGSVTPAPVAIAAAGSAAFRVRFGAAEDWLLHENSAGLVAWAGGWIAARTAVLTAGGAFAAVDLTRVVLPERLEAEADAPVDLAWTPAETELTRWSDGAGIRLRWPGADLAVRTGGCLEVAYTGSRPHRLVLALARPAHVTVNGVARGLVAGPGATLLLAPHRARPPRAQPTTVDAVYRLLDEPAVDHTATLARLLAPAADWRLQAAAADVAGQLRLPTVVPALLDLFAAGEAELPYPPLQTWWRASKMLRNPKAREGDDPALPRPLGEKRWRVQLAVVIALGRIGDPRAIPPLEAALARCTDFFPVTSQLGVALGRLGATCSAPVLEKHRNHAEVNTRLHARLALALLRGEVTRTEFEARVGLA